MDDKPLLDIKNREGLIQRLKRLENEVEEIKKELGPTEQKMDETKELDTSECCRDCATCCILCSLFEVLNRR
jgi:hypothetical protein